MRLFLVGALLVARTALAANLITGDNVDRMDGGGTSTWVTASGAVTTYMTVDGHNATRIVDTGGIGYVRLTNLSLTEGATYTYSFCAKNNGGTVAAGGIRDGDTAGNIVASSSYFSTINDNYAHQIAYTFTVPAGHNAQFQPIWQYSSAGVNVYIWGNQLNTGSSPETNTCTAQNPASNPTFSPTPTVYSSQQSITLSCTSPGSTIYYNHTTNGDTPADPTHSSTVYAAPFNSVSVGVSKIKAICAAPGYDDSNVTSGNYTISPPAATPEASPIGGTYAAQQSVTMTCTTPSSSIYYTHTTDGSVPADPTDASTLYTTAVATQASGTDRFKLRCYASGYSASSINTVTYTISPVASGQGYGFLRWAKSAGRFIIGFVGKKIVVGEAPPIVQASAPTVSPASSAVRLGSALTISCSTPNSAALCDTGSGYSACGSTVASAGSINIKCAGTNLTDSSVVARTYTQATALQPSMSPGSGSSTSSVGWTATCTSPSSLPYYTTDGSTPTTSSTQGGSGTAAVTTTVRAVCGSGGYLTSSISSATYTISQDTPEPPPVDPPSPLTGGSYTATSDACWTEPITPPAWQASHLYVFGQRVTNDGGRVYQMISTTYPTGGLSASSGGPTGTGGSISDGQLTWAYSMASANGAVRYVCDCATGADSRCVAGSNGNNGTSAATPWQTLEAGKTWLNTASAGSTLAFCRGGRFAAANDASFYGSNCTATNNCIIRDYIPPWDTSQTATRPTIYAGAGRARGMPFMQGGAGYRVMNIRAVGGGPTWGYGLSNTLTDLTICNNSIEWFGQGVQDDCGDHSPTTQRTVIIGNRFYNNTGQGVLVGGPGTIINSNYFDGNGREYIRDHSIYMSWHATSPTTMQASYNEIYNNCPQAGNRCDAPSIVAHGTHQGTKMIGNLIDHHGGNTGGNCFGLQFSPGGYGHAEYCRGCTISNNRVYGVGAVGIELQMATDSYIENNLIIVENNGSGGVQAIRLMNSDWAGDDNSRDVVRNNTVYFTSGATSGTFQGVFWGSEGSQHVLANNTFYFAGGGYSTCGVLESTYTAITNNNCYGFGSVGFSGTFTTTSNPQFTTLGNSQAANFTPAAGSPLVNAGSGTYAPSLDLTFKARDGNPDIGAYER